LSPDADDGRTAMWPWIIGVVLLLAVTVVVMNRRGSTGASKADDLPPSHGPDGSKGTEYGSGGGGF
jgi:hypothetical protein